MANRKALDLIKEFEGFRKNAYQDEEGNWTIGYGTTRYWDGTPVKKGDTISLSDADYNLEKVASHYENIIKEMVLDSVLNDNQLAALISFVYNIGPSSFSKSTMLKYIIENNIQKAANEFLRWIYLSNPKTNKKVRSEGLINRRIKERDLFLS